MKVVKLDIPEFVLSTDSTILRDASDKAWKSNSRVVRHVYADRKARRPAPNDHLFTEQAKARLDRARLKWDIARATFRESLDREYDAWLAAGRSEIDRLLVAGNSVEVRKDQRDLLDYALTRGYESTFGQTSAGCHSSYSVRMNSHAVPWPDQETVVLSPDQTTDVVWCTYWPPALRKEMLEAVGQPPVISMDGSNFAYQRELLRG